jgi:hypothetical protein
VKWRRRKVFTPRRALPRISLHPHTAPKEHRMFPKRLAIASAAGLLLALAACAGALDEQMAHAAPAGAHWPPVWQSPPAWPQDEVAPPAFEPPRANHCHRAPTLREVPGGGAEQGASSWRRGRGEADGAARESRMDAGLAALSNSEALRSAPAGAAPHAPVAADRAAPLASAKVAPPPQAEMSIAPWPRPQPLPQRPAHETVTAGMVDDNADFGEYLAYRQRHAGLPVRERDISERTLLEVTDANGRPVHDAEVAVQRPGVVQPVMWARTDTAGRVWLHPRVFMGGGFGDERNLSVAVRKGGLQSRAALQRGQANAVQVQLGGSVTAQRPRLDLVFLVDATGSMGDEIAKLKSSMRAVAQQIAQLPGQPDICYGLVAYRDRGDAFLTRSHDFTDDLGAFQQALGRVQAGGGGDTPEALNEALHETVHRLDWRVDAARMVVLVADAPPHLDYGGCVEPPEAYGFGPPGGRRAGLGRPGACPQYDRDMQAALAKGIKLFAVGASGLDPVGEYIFRQMAQYTAGRFVFLTYKEGADPASGPGTQTGHDVGQYSVQTLDKLIVRLVSDEMAKLARS